MTENTQQIDRGPRRSGGALADMVSRDESRRFGQVFPQGTCAKVGVLAILFCGLNFWQFGKLAGLWQHDANWSHGFLIPLFSLYLLYVRWDELTTAKRKVCLWGLPILLGGIAVMVVSVHPISNLWLAQLSMIPMLLGLVLYLAGAQILRVAWLPIVYLALAMPIPDILYQDIALPLQNLAAWGTTGILQLFGVEIETTASNLTIKSISGKEYPLLVVEACSGVRSLMAFVALSVAMAYIDDRPTWQRVVLVASSLPITVFCNIIRVAVTSTMFVIDRPELGKDFMHTFVGMALLVPALLMLLGLGWLLRNLFVEHEEEHDPESKAERPAAEDGA